MVGVGTSWTCLAGFLDLSKDEAVLKEENFPAVSHRQRIHDSQNPNTKQLALLSNVALHVGGKRSHHPSGQAHKHTKDQGQRWTC